MPKFKLKDNKGYIYYNMGRAGAKKVLKKK